MCFVRSILVYSAFTDWCEWRILCSPRRRNKLIRVRQRKIDEQRISYQIYIRHKPLAAAPASIYILCCHVRARLMQWPVCIVNRIFARPLSAMLICVQSKQHRDVAFIFSRNSVAKCRWFAHHKCSSDASLSFTFIAIVCASEKKNEAYSIAHLSICIQIGGNRARTIDKNGKNTRRK